MIIVNCKQGSDEWLDYRKGLVTCSQLSSIITPLKGDESKSIGKYAKKLALEILYDKITENSFKSAAMQAGNDLEETARKAYQEKTLKLVEEVGIIIEGQFGFSPDGLVGEDGIIEIKCLEAEAHSNIILKNEIPIEYKCQIQGGLWISQRKWCDFIVYNKYFKNIDKKLLIFRMERDEDFIGKLLILANKCVTLRDEIIKILTIK